MSSSGNKWWLALDGKSEGPFGIEEIAARLRSGQIAASTPVCLVDSTDWKPLSSWPELAAATSPGDAATPPPPPPPPPFPQSASPELPHGGPSEPVLTNPLLPQMANWICIYSIGLTPVIWFVDHMLCCVDGTFSQNDPSMAAVTVVLNVLSALESLVATVLLVIGGIRLRRLRASGVTLIRIGLLVGLIGGAIIVALFVVGGIAAAAASGDSDTTSTSASTTASTLISAVQLLIGFCEMLFMIVSLVWLTKHQHELPLTPGT